MKKNRLIETAGKATIIAKGAASGAANATKATKGAAAGASRLAREVPPPSPNPMTNLIIADVALRSGGQLLRHAVERALLGMRYSKGKARAIVKGRSMTETLLGTAIARIATRSVPGALAVGGGLLAKTLYDRSKDRRAAKAKGDAAVEQRVEDA